MIDNQEIIKLLQQLIATQSFSKEEDKTADIIELFFKKQNIPTQRKGNNVWAKNAHYTVDEGNPENIGKGLPTILLNSHHDTVKPVKAWTHDPFSPNVTNGKLFGLGSNDAGGALVSLMAVFCKFYKKKLPYNLIIAATAEEEISGANGVASILNDLGKIDVGIVGEPTLMQMAVAEKGLMVIDGYAQGRAGHAAREEGINAIYVAMEDIKTIRHFNFEKESAFLGKVKLSVTQIEAGTQHNVVPDVCKFVIDVRSNECYTNEEIYEILQKNVKSELKPRSFRLNSSKIDLNHPLILRGHQLGLTHYGSPTLSDQALMPFDTLKIGPGDSARSHTADEFIYVKEIEEGIAIYEKLLENLIL
jgi:acetylornithine deacetylase